jgi:hypothetical protein
MVYEKHEFFFLNTREKITKQTGIHGKQNTDYAVCPKNAANFLVA